MRSELTQNIILPEQVCVCAPIPPCFVLCGKLGLSIWKGGFIFELARGSTSEQLTVKVEFSQVEFSRVEPGRVQLS